MPRGKKPKEATLTERVKAKTDRLQARRSAIPPAHAGESEEECRARVLEVWEALKEAQSGPDGELVRLEMLRRKLEHPDPVMLEHNVLSGNVRAHEEPWGEIGAMFQDVLELFLRGVNGRTLPVRRKQRTYIRKGLRSARRGRRQEALHRLGAATRPTWQMDHEAMQAGFEKLERLRQRVYREVRHPAVAEVLRSRVDTQRRQVEGASGGG